MKEDGKRGQKNVSRERRKGRDGCKEISLARGHARIHTDHSHSPQLDSWSSGGDAFPQSLFKNSLPSRPISVDSGPPWLIGSMVWADVLWEGLKGLSNLVLQMHRERKKKGLARLQGKRVLQCISTDCTKTMTRLHDIRSNPTQYFVL
jgi:hypothetical protein